jgi:hypothetical protein
MRLLKDIDKPIVVNMFAGPGTGKSTSAAAVFSLLKMHDVNAELITEFAKDLTWEERHRTLDNQYYIWAKQHHRMWRIKDQVEVIVTDSPLILSLVYGQKTSEYFNALVLESFEEFNNMNYTLIRMKKFNPRGRNQTYAESKGLDLEIIQKLHDLNIRSKLVPGNFEGINDIVKRVLRRLRKQARIILQENDSI